MKRIDLLKSKEYWTTRVQLELFELIETYRKENGLNQTQLADKLGVSKGYISQILNGNFDHKVSKLVEIALAFGKVPILKYEDMDRYIMHDSLNISTTVGLIKDIDFTYDFSSVQHFKTIEKKVETTNVRGTESISFTVKTSTVNPLKKAHCSI